MANEIIFYRTPDGEQRIEVVFQNENFWMSQKALADLFAVGIPAINKHLANIYASGELTEAATVSKMEIVRTEGTRAGRRIYFRFRPRSETHPRENQEPALRLNSPARRSPLQSSWHYG